MMNYFTEPNLAEISQTQICCTVVWIRNQLGFTFVLSFISLLQVAQHVSVQPCAHLQELTTV